MRTYLPCLREKMKLVGANYHLLSAASGISVQTIWKALKGNTIPVLHAECLYEALNARTFQRKRNGRQL